MKDKRDINCVDCGVPCARHLSQYRSLSFRLAEERQRVAKLEKALRTFGGHKHWCARRNRYGADCDCGYDAALSTSTTQGTRDAG